VREWNCLSLLKKRKKGGGFSRKERYQGEPHRPEGGRKVVADLERKDPRGGRPLRQGEGKDFRSGRGDGRACSRPEGQPDHIVKV